MYLFTISAHMTYELAEASQSLLSFASTRIPGQVLASFIVPKPASSYGRHEKEARRLASRKVPLHPSLAVTHADRKPCIFLKVRNCIMNWLGLRRLDREGVK